MAVGETELRIGRVVDMLMYLGQWHGAFNYRVKFVWGGNLFAYFLFDFVFMNLLVRSECTKMCYGDEILSRYIV